MEVEQVFRITVMLESDVSSGEARYLTEEIVRRQIQKFLSRDICEGIPCHGTGSLKVLDVEESV